MQLIQVAKDLEPGGYDGGGLWEFVQTAKVMLERLLKRPLTLW
jgi:hypothetical protein